MEDTSVGDNKVRVGPSEKESVIKATMVTPDE